MVMKKLLILVLILFTLTSFSTTMFWGKIGHRTVGEIAQRQLTLTTEQH